MASTSGGSPLSIGSNPVQQIFIGVSFNRTGYLASNQMMRVRISLHLSIKDVWCNQVALLAFNREVEGSNPFVFIKVLR